ncbi:chymotrypsin-2-like [Musca vetustissima]|uniref:chymotrypsin-2-like n=1 Tax=Musca vetustissima TaxID=27455 RepID=UPI002AB7154F|nr:chymotrypsin-2-like [Musca vetustissima]
MYTHEDMKKFFKLAIILLLCSEMQPSDTQLDTYENRILYYRADHNATVATLDSSKYHASIRLKEKDGRYGAGHICSGALIAPSVVLTAASCVYNYDANKPYHPSELKVVLGSVSRYQKHEQTLIYSVTHNYQSPGFDAIKLRDNLAILMLENDVPEMNANIKPITLQTYNTNWYSSKADMKFKVTTWLETQEGLFLNPLMFLDASRIENEECLKQYGPVYGPGMLCMRTMESTMQHDVGSPLFLDNKLIGLMSINNGLKNPAIFTDVAYHGKWIREVIGDGHHKNSAIWGMLGFLALTWLALKRIKYFKF